MKLLRKSIRKIILENCSHFEKVAKMLCEKDPERVNQGIQIAQSLGYIKTFSYGGPKEDHWNRGFNHLWRFEGVDSSFAAALEKEWEVAKPATVNAQHRIEMTVWNDCTHRWTIVINNHHY